MTARPSEVLHQALRAFVRGDFEAMLELADPEIELYIPDNPEQQNWRGRSQTLEAVMNWTGAFDHYAVELESVEEAGNRAMAVIVQRGRAQLTGGPVEARNGYVIEVREGLVTRWELYSDPAEARAALNA